MTNIALVDDDRNILTSVSIALENEGHTVKTYNDGQAALHAFERRMPDLAVIDVKMPRLDGYELLQRIRKKSAIPVIFLTSKDQEIDEVFGLRLGANDYVKKPFSQTLLIERIRSLLRQQEIINNPDGTAYEEDRVIERGHFRLDPLRHVLTWKGKEVPVTVTEFLVVEALIKRPGYVRTRDQLMDAVYDEKIYVDDRTIDSHIKRLRKKMRLVDEFFKSFETIYGIGYRYNMG